MSKILLERYIYSVIKEEAEYLELPDLPDNSNDITWGDLRKIVEAIRNSYKSKDKIKKVIGALKLVPGFALIGTVDNQFFAEVAELGIGKVLAFLYNINGKKPSNKSNFQVDPNVSKLIDDEVERKFIFWLADFCKKVPDDKKLVDFDMTETLQNWLDNDGASEYGGANVTK